MQKRIDFEKWYDAFADDIDEMVEDILDFIDTITYNNIQPIPELRTNLLQYIYQHSHSAFPRNAHLYLT